MKFNEKLQKLRKENQMSQEQLADLLDVSRQAVSKWESGTTYPEMDKLLMLCKIFKCSLDELTNDDVEKITVEEKESIKKKNWLNILLDYLKQTIEMLKNMTPKNILLMIFKLLIVFLIIVLLSIPVSGLYTLGKEIFFIMGDGIGEVLSKLWLFLLSVSYFLLGVTIFFYTFKIQYLDTYSNQKYIENNEKKEEEESGEEKVQIIYKQLPTSSIFQSFGKLCTYMCKAILFFITIPFAMFFILLFIAFIILIYLLFNKVFYIGFLMIDIFSILLTFIIIKFLMEVLFAQKINFNNMFRLIILAIAGIGISIGACIFDIADTTYKNTIPENIKISTISKTIPYEEDLFIESYYFSEAYIQYYPMDTYDISYIEDESLTDSIKIEIEYVDSFQTPIIYVSQDKEIIITGEKSRGNFKDIILHDLQNKSLHNYELLYQLKVNIYASKKTMQSLKQNLIKYITQEERLENCLTENRELQHQINYPESNDYEIEELQNQIASKDEYINVLKREKEEIEQELNHYKDTINSLK